MAFLPYDIPLYSKIKINIVTDDGKRLPLVVIENNCSIYDVKCQTSLEYIHFLKNIGE